MPDGSAASAAFRDGERGDVPGRFIRDEAGRKQISIEFRSLSERRTKGGVREVLRAFVDVAAPVASPEHDSTACRPRGAGHGISWLVDAPGAAAAAVHATDRQHLAV